MGEDDKPTVYKINDTEVIYKGIFNMKQLYVLVHEWLDEEEFYDEFGKYKYMEKMYYEKRRANKGRYLRIWWKTSKTPDGSKYFRYRLDVEFFVIRMRDVDVVRNGKKVRADQADEVKVVVRSWLDVDYQNFIGGSMLLRPFRRIFEMIWLKREREYHWAFLLEKANQLQREVKTNLEMKNFLNQKTPFQKKVSDNPLS